MKKFLLCIAAGYLLVFLLFLGLVKRTGRMPLKDGPALSHGLKNPSTRKIPQPSRKDSEKIPAPKDFKKDPELEKFKNTGPIETFYKSGRLSSEWVLDEKKSGFFKTYFQDGKPWQEFLFQGGLPQGEWKTFAPDGSFFLDETFDAGEREGSVSAHYASGGTLASFVFTRGILSGTPQFWSEDARPAQAPVLSAAGSAGYFKAYDEQGREYVHWQQGASGDTESKLSAHYLTGAVSLEWVWNNQAQEGKAVFLGPQGQRRLEYVFHQGHLTEGRLYSDSGTLLTQLQTSPDGLTAEAKGFYPGGEILWTLQRLTSEKGQRVYALKTFWEDQRTTQARP